jgi:hypothetical protein
MIVLVLPITPIMTTIPTVLLPITTTVNQIKVIPGTSKCVLVVPPSITITTSTMMCVIIAAI